MEGWNTGLVEGCWPPPSESCRDKFQGLEKSNPWKPGIINGFGSVPSLSSGKIPDAEVFL
jgi:hypothetical protein